MRLSWLSLAVVLPLAACGSSGSGNEGPVAAGVVLVPGAATLADFDSAQFRAYRVNADGDSIGGGSFVYSALAPTVATVTASGMVHGVGGGTALIVVADGAHADTASIDVADTVHLVIDASPAHDSRPYGVAVGTGGVAYVTFLDNAGTARYNTATHTLAKDSIPVGAIPTGVASRPDNAEAYVASQNGSVTVIKTANDSVLGTIAIPAAGFNVGISSNGTKAFIGTNGSKLYVISTATHAITDSVTADGAGNGFTSAPAGDKMFWTDFVGGTVRKITVSSDASGIFATIGGMPQGLAFSSDGSKLFVARQASGDVLILNGSTGARIDSIAVTGGQPFGLARRPGTELIWVTTLNGRLVVIDPATKNLVGDRDLGGKLRRIAFGHDGEAVIADEDGRVIFAH